MKEVIVHPLPTLHTTIHEVPIPVPGPDEILIKVIVAGSNIKDWLHPTLQSKSLNSGDDIAGTIHALGSNIKQTNEFQLGDRVAAMHKMGYPHGAYAEYAIALGSLTFKIPDGMSYEEAATIPLITTTAALTLYRRQCLPTPWTPLPSYSAPTPLLIYGASSALGTACVKLARASNIHPLICIAGSNASSITPFLNSSKGDVLIDYRPGIDAMKNEVSKALNGRKCSNAIDCISSNGTWIPISQMLAEGAVLSVVTGSNKYEEADIKQGIKIMYTMVGTAYEGSYKPGMVKQPDKEEVRDDPEWTWVFIRYLARMLHDGRMSGYPYEVVDGGLDGVERGLRASKNGSTRGRKCVYRVGEVEE